jgi:A/G-specific adenine glycosylase
VEFTKQLLAWFANNHRPMPWKGERNPYLVWLSEIILQQTRVEQGMPYFERFASAYPTVTDLANAPQDEVMKLWEGLGYYSRARNLHTTAQYIATELNGVFPSTYQDLLTLKGVGTYTAAAVASFAYDLPHAVLDGNVYRVLSRYFAMADPIDLPPSKSTFTQLANELLDKNRPADYNQAIMDFGATQCMPANPACKKCPLSNGCLAFKNGTVNQYPVKNKKIPKKIRYMHYLVVNNPKSETILIRKRTEKDIWQDLYELPLLETTDGNADWSLWLDKYPELQTQEVNQKGVSTTIRHLLTHREILCNFREIVISSPKTPFFEDFLPLTRKNLYKFAFPKLILRYLTEQINQLSLDI